MPNQEVTALIATDLSAEINTVTNDNLINVLAETEYDVSGTALSFVDSNLLPRNQSTYRLLRSHGSTLLGLVNNV